jgi:hypothetical protein
MIKFETRLTGNVEEALTAFEKKVADSVAAGNEAMKKRLNQS